MDPFCGVAARALVERNLRGGPCLVSTIHAVHGLHDGLIDERYSAKLRSRPYAHLLEFPRQIELAARNFIEFAIVARYSFDIWH